jgi:hypothetical protein
MNITVGDVVICNKLDVDLVVGNTYTVDKVDVWDKPVVYLKDCGGRPYYASYFSLVKNRSMEEKLEIAKSYIGKTVKIKTNTTKFTVKKVNIVLDHHDAELLKVGSMVVLEEISNVGYAVVVSDDSVAYPVLSVEPVEEVEVRLKNNYSAIVSKDTIKVGCQTFPSSILEELMTAYKSLN